MEVTGRIRAILPAQSGWSQRTGSTWMSQDYVLDYFWWPNQTMASQMVFRVFGEERIKAMNLQVNDEVKINYHIEAREYNGRWYNEIQCNNAEKVGAREGESKPAADADGNGG